MLGILAEPGIPARKGGHESVKRSLDRRFHGPDVTDVINRDRTHLGDHFHGLEIAVIEDAFESLGLDETYEAVAVPERCAESRKATAVREREGQALSGRQDLVPVARVQLDR